MLRIMWELLVCVKSMHTLKTSGRRKSGGGEGRQLAWTVANKLMCICVKVVKYSILHLSEKSVMEYSCHSSHFTSPDLISADLVSPEMSALRLVIATANWVMPVKRPVLLWLQPISTHSVHMKWAKLRWGEVRWGEVRWDEWYECSLTRRLAHIACVEAADSSPASDQMHSPAPMFDSRDTVRGTMQRRLQNIDLMAGEPVHLLLPTTPPKPVVIEVRSACWQTSLDLASKAYKNFMSVISWILEQSVQPSSLGNGH